MIEIFFALMVSTLLLVDWAILRRLERLTDRVRSLEVEDYFRKHDVRPGQIIPIE